MRIHRKFKLPRGPTGRGQGSLSQSQPQQEGKSVSYMATGMTQEWAASHIRPLSTYCCDKLPAKVQNKAFSWNYSPPTEGKIGLFSCLPRRLHLSCSAKQHGTHSAHVGTWSPATFLSILSSPLRKI